MTKNIVTVDPTRREPFYYEDYAVGQRFVSRGRTVTDADIRLHVGATGADHPNHSDEEYCKNHPVLKGVCAHGLLILSLVDGFITEELPKYMGPSMNYGHEKVRYIAPVYSGDTIHAEIEIVKCREKNHEWGLLELEVNAINQDGICVVYDHHVLIVQKRCAITPA
ncbi:MaoC family dehydratase [Nocardia sp. CA-119907]|uniref:MaoC family dehydratase n=1 Tax=Nocardia sp. CA-119907 TaxID=3239973 RepID=UPI003D95E212